MGVKFVGGPEPGRNRMARAEANGHRVDVSKAKLVGAEGAEERFKIATAKAMRCDQIVQGLANVVGTAAAVTGPIKIGNHDEFTLVGAPGFSPVLLAVEAAGQRARELMPEALVARAAAFAEVATLQLDQIEGALGSLAPESTGAPSGDAAGPSSPKADEGGAPGVSS